MNLKDMKVGETKVFAFTFKWKKDDKGYYARSREGFVLLPDNLQNLIKQLNLHDSKIASLHVGNNNKLWTISINTKDVNLVGSQVDALIQNNLSRMTENNNAIDFVFPTK